MSMVTPTMRRQYPHTPEPILAYLDKPSKKVEKAFAHQGEATVWQMIDHQFKYCSVITQLTIDDLLAKLDFQNDNQDHDSFPALFAVMRTIMLLHEHLGFEKITPLRKMKKKPEADLFATRHGVTYAIEVYRTKEENPLDHSVELGEHIAKRYNGNKGELGKKEQLRLTMKNHNCSRAVFVAVFDSSSCNLYSKHALRDAADCARVEMGMPNKTHVLIFTGVEKDQTSEEDECWAIEPALPD